MSGQGGRTNHINVTYHDEILPQTYAALVAALKALNVTAEVTFELRRKPRAKESS
jgi:hypothetical protein